MIGAIIGDIAGSFYELKEYRTKDYNFDMFPEGSRFTDDTTFTLAVAEAYIEYTKKHVNDYEIYKEILLNRMVYYGKKYDYFSRRTREWLDNPIPYGSFGTGAAMRVSALPYLINDENKLKQIVKITTDVSHNNKEAEDAAEVCALCVFHLLHGKDKAYIHRLVKDNYYKYIDNYSYENMHRHFDFYMPTQMQVQLAINCFLESVSFEDCLRKSVSLGGDADTQAAIACSMAWIYYGIDEIFEKKALSYLPDDFINILNEIEKETYYKK